MTRHQLTRKQKSIIAELDEISSLFSLDYNNILDYEKEARTPYLEAARDKIIRAQVVIWYTLVDEFLNTELSNYFFGKNRDFIRLWKTKRFRNFNYYVLEELHLMQKLRFVKAIRHIPKAIASDIERLNALRNGLAHAFFPENLRKSKPIYKGKNIFSVDGIKLLQDDMDQVGIFLLGYEPQNNERLTNGKLALAPWIGDVEMMVGYM